MVCKCKDVPLDICLPYIVCCLITLEGKFTSHLGVYYVKVYYCRYVITGADDLLIKLWSSYTGRLIATFRGASSEITDIAIDSENHLLAAGSIDRILRVKIYSTFFKH